MSEFEPDRIFALSRRGHARAPADRVRARRWRHADAVQGPRAADRADAGRPAASAASARRQFTSQCANLKRVLENAAAASLTPGSGAPARGDLLHRPAVAVRVAEEEEADVVERVRLRPSGSRRRPGSRPASTPRSSSSARAAREVGARRAGGPCSEPGSMSGHDALADHDRAARPGRGELHDPHARRRSACRGRREAELLRRRRPSRGPRPRTGTTTTSSVHCMLPSPRVWVDTHMTRRGRGTHRPGRGRVPCGHGPLLRGLGACSSRSRRSSGRPKPLPQPMKSAAPAARVLEARAARSGLGDLRLLTVSHVGFDGRTHQRPARRQPAAPTGAAQQGLPDDVPPTASRSATCASGTSTAPSASGPNDVTASFECRQAVPSPCTGGSGTGTLVQPRLRARRSTSTRARTRTSAAARATTRRRGAYRNRARQRAPA